MNSAFLELGIVPELTEVLAGLGYEEPTPIQRRALPPLLAGRDVLGQAGTGTGKTAAFALPLVQRLCAGKEAPSKPLALVLVPTRELAVQVAEAFHTYGGKLGIVVMPVYGGQPFGRQATALRRGVHVVVATPGRALDHLRRGTLDPSSLSTVVLDEADEMLDMGFAEDIEAILDALPAKRQTALFSATLPPRIAAIANRRLTDPERILIPREKAAKDASPRVRQTAYLVPRPYKMAALSRVLDVEEPELAIVFTRTRTEVDELCDALHDRGHQVEALHGGMSQEQRDRVMRRVRANDLDLLVATDVAARGLDVDHVSHVINFNVPPSPESYVHRIGRTGRAGRSGVAITLAEPREQRLLRNIEHLTGQRIDAAAVPTSAEIRKRRLDTIRHTFGTTVAAGRLEPYVQVAQTLVKEFDAVQVVAAAIKLVHGTTRRGADDDVEIPVFDRPPPQAPRRSEPSRGKPQRGDDHRNERGHAPACPPSASAGRGKRPRR